MGHSDRERRRLALQASILNPFTEHLLARTGLRAGMTVLDFGCGIGDVSLIAARLVGPAGRVTAIDLDSDALASAQARAREQSLSNISFVRASIDAFEPEAPADAVVGRHILIHSRDPLTVLRRASKILRPGGVAAFQEFDFSLFLPSFPPLPLRDRACAVFSEFFLRAIHGNIGGRLFHLFSEAGFEAPDCRAEAPMGGGQDRPHYEWLAESLRSILPRAQAMGIGLEFVDTIDSLEERLRSESLAARASAAGPMMVAGFARKGVTAS
jgi:ubiquinone/menaquinone biosynthesis C-methylase UbiE